MKGNMRKTSICAVATVLVAVCAAVPAAQRKYGVTVTPEKNVDYGSFRTYEWRRAQPSSDKTIDAQITSAIDKELLALGITKAASSPPDVYVAYSSLTRTDVDLKGKQDEKGLLPQSWVGTLIVAFNEPATDRRLLRMRVDLPIDIQPGQLEAAINNAVSVMFAEYPTRRRKN